MLTIQTIFVNSESGISRKTAMFSGALDVRFHLFVSSLFFPIFVNIYVYNY